MSRKRIVLVLLAAPFLAAALFLAYRAMGPHRFYRVDVVLPAPGANVAPGELLVGVAKRDITPNLAEYDPWTDADNDGRYNPDKGDTYEDRNGNGKFDAVWMAGFSNNRPAKGVHDPLWVRAIAFRNNGVTVAMATIDGIGIFHEAYIDIRKSIDPSLNVDHVMFSALHNHEAPDTMGIWSQSPFRPSFDGDYLESVKRASKDAVEEAVRNMAPAEAILAERAVGPEGFVDDSREPQVFDNVIRCARFVKKGTDETIGTMMVWGNHVETLGSRNSLLTSDFAHYWREGVEKGVPDPDGVSGFGAMALYFQGQVGGLMTQLHTTVPHRDGTRSFSEASFEKAEALGQNLAIETVNALRGEPAWRAEHNTVAVAAKTIFVPVDGLFHAAMFLGVIHPGWYWGKFKTEVNAIRIGDIEILTIPGESYPEIGEGGITTPDGADYPVEPVEVPPLRSRMAGKLNLIVNLANDEVGYLIPKSQWDTEPPYAYGETDEPQYGEENSPGSDAAGAIHRESLAVLERLHDTLDR